MANLTMPAEWRACKQFPGYEVSSDGRVRKDGRIRKRQVHLWGYVAIAITAKPKQRKVFVHRLVADAFLPSPGAGQTEVDHVNGIKWDNRAENLRWVDRATNIATRRSRGSGPTARELQVMGKASTSNLDIDGRTVAGRWG